MNHLILFAHFNANSFGNALKNTAAEQLKAKGDNVEVRDLYEINFNPTLSFNDMSNLRNGKIPEDILEEQKWIRWADTISVIHPIWWTGLPGILKGYFDRVFTYGFAYQYTEKGVDGMLAGKKAIIISTHGTPLDIYKQSGMIDAFGKTIDDGIFKFCGIDIVKHIYFGAVPTADSETLKSMIGEIKDFYSNL